MADKLDPIERDKELHQYKEKFVRWQQLTIGQLSVTNNLIFTLTTGILGFTAAVTKLRLPDSCLDIFFLSLNYFLLFLSLLAGLLLTINRLADFRGTKDIVALKRKRFETEQEIENHGRVDELSAQITELKTKNNKLGKETWCLLSLQLWTFTLGTVLSIVTVIRQNN